MCFVEQKSVFFGENHNVFSPWWIKWGHFWQKMNFFFIKWQKKIDAASK
jgi:hypothetical protein